MANVLSLALRITADASGLRLDPAQRALARLGDEADKLTAQFDKFASGSGAAAAAQEKFAGELETLRNRLRDGLGATQFTIEFEKLTEAINQEAAAFERAARITDANLTAFERFERAQVELRQQVDAGRITQETYNRAIEAAAKGLTDAERAAAGLVVQQRAIEQSAETTTLRFNELSGIFAVLPGPLGNVAGRISGIASASEGLARVFAGGLRSGLTNIVGSFTALVNPVTAALAGVAAFGAGAAALTRGLSELDGRVEKLGNTADKLGVSFDFVQTLDEAARRSGTSIDGVSAAFGRLQKSVLGVDEESKAAQKALEQIGIAAQELEELSPEEQYQKIGRAIASIEDPARRTAAATALFGREGANLLPFFNNIERARADVERFGSALSEIDRGRIDSLGDAFDSVFVSLQGLGQSVLLPFVGLVEGVAVAFSGLVNIVTAVAQSIGTVLTPILNSVGAAFGVVGNAINGTVGFFRRLFGGAEEASKAVKATADNLRSLAEEEAKQAEAREKFLSGFTANVSRAINASTEFGNAGFEAALQYQNAIARLQEQLDRGILNEESFSREAERAAAAYQTQIDAIKQAAAETQAITNQVAELLEKSQELPRLQQEIIAVEAEIARLEAAAVQARAQGQTEQATQFAAQLARLDQLQANLNQQADEAAQGFESGFDEAFQSATSSIQSLTQSAVQFGEEGFAAAQRLADGIAAAQEQVRDGILNQAAFDAEVARQQELYNQRIAQLEDERERRLKIEQDIANERQRINRFVDEQLALAEFGGDSARLNASRNVAAIEAEIARVQAEVVSARQAGDNEAARAGSTRIAQLREIAEKENDIASGRKAAEEEIAKRRAESIRAQEKAAADALRAQEQQAREADTFRRQQAQEAQRALQAQAAEFQKTLEQQAAENQRRLERSRLLNTASSQVAAGVDIRTQEGARAFLQALQGGFDPQLALAQQQLQVQRRIAFGLEQNLNALGFQTFRFPVAAGA